MARRKRSQAIALTGMMAGAISISGCDDRSSATQWQASNASSMSGFSTLQDCTASGRYSAEVCERALGQALNERDSKAPHFSDPKSCETQFGQCAAIANGRGGSVFVPMLAAFVVGQAMSGGAYRGSPVYTRQPGRDDDQRRNYGGGGGGGYIGSGGRSADSGYSSSRSSGSRAVSRGGFGGGGHGFFGG
jgi:uncharacterized protein YgiB involved in biofilm formation